MSIYCHTMSMLLTLCEKNVEKSLNHVILNEVFVILNEVKDLNLHKILRFITFHSE